MVVSIYFTSPLAKLAFWFALLQELFASRCKNWHLQLSQSYMQNLYPGRARQYIVNILGQDGTNLKHLGPRPSFGYVADYESRLEMTASRDHESICIRSHTNLNKCSDKKNFHWSTIIVQQTTQLRCTSPDIIVNKQFKV